MARFTTSATSSRPAAEVFNFMADMRNAPSWDPGVASAEKTSDGPVGLGTVYRVNVIFLGRTMPLDYRVADYEPTREVVLRAENSYIISSDWITVSESGGTTTATYYAELCAKGAAGLLGPTLGIALNRIGKRAEAGLRKALAP